MPAKAATPTAAIASKATQRPPGDAQLRRQADDAKGRHHAQRTAEPKGKRVHDVSEQAGRHDEEAYRRRDEQRETHEPRRHVQVQLGRRRSPFAFRSRHAYRFPSPSQLSTRSMRSCWECVPVFL